MATGDQTRNESTVRFNFNSIMIGTAQLEVVAAFYETLFGRPADMNDGGYAGWQVGNGFLMVGAHSEINGQSKEPARIILNIETSAVKEEFERLKALGVTVIKEPYDMEGGWIATLADPDGNYLQLMTPFEM